MKKNVYELIIKTDANKLYNLIFSSRKKAEKSLTYYPIGDLYGSTIERITNTHIVKRVLF